MEKTIIALTIALGFTAAHAGPPLCPHMEFAEMQTYSDKELMDYYHQRLVVPPSFEPESAQSCIDESRRVDRVLVSRGKSIRYYNTQAKEKEAGKADQSKS